MIPFLFATRIKRDTDRLASPRRRFLRTFFAWLAGAVVGDGFTAGCRPSEKTKKDKGTPKGIKDGEAAGAKRAETGLFRPPGSGGENRFLTQCLRCGVCVSACPTGILKPVSSPWAALGTPAVDFEAGECARDCVRCGAVCPTGAIPPFTPKEKETLPIALAEIDVTRCLVYYDRECSICRRECPVGAISFTWSKEEYLNIPSVDPILCNGCGRCLHLCPGLSETLKTETGFAPNADRRTVRMIPVPRRDAD